MSGAQLVAYSYACSCGSRITVNLEESSRVDVTCPVCSLKHRVYQCGFCRDYGHNVRTCEAKRRIEQVVKSVAELRDGAIASLRFGGIDDEYVTEVDAASARSRIRFNRNTMERAVHRLNAAITEADLFLNPELAEEAHRGD